MAAKRLLILLIIVAAIVTVAALRYTEDIRSKENQLDDQRFVKAYVELSIAKQLYEFNPDSLEAISTRIFKKNEVDSTWMEDHLRKIERNTDRFEKTWRDITETLDSLKKNLGSDSQMPF